MQYVSHLSTLTFHRFNEETQREASFLSRNTNLLSCSPEGDGISPAVEGQGGGRGWKVKLFDKEKKRRKKGKGSRDGRLI